MSNLERLYQAYLRQWYREHDEGDPACFDEWYTNEYLLGE